MGKNRKIYQVFLLLGTNLGNRENNLKQAKALIAMNCGKIIQTSRVYETAAWGITNQPSFLNEVLQIEIETTPQVLIKKLLEIELQLGRKRIVKMGPRLIDIDILLTDDLIIDEENLQVPHPRMHERKFVLLPLNEIANNIIHPIFKISIQELLLKCEDSLTIRIYTANSK